ncbi:DUF6262 family protein [Streptomyces parvus]|uniref:DUF6262 family protein n=1 Tax=Streptomyces parvus TaxID=66428 RepID=UPI00210138ED|nr:DUF6262 family protein [Streptomyces parvus]MCQ1579715.1 DUF6262 family protein [Streptomyces parvus]
MNNAAPSAAIAARRRQTEEKLAQAEAAISRLRRERGRLTVRAVAERAAVSATFLYENPDARTLVKNAVTSSDSRHDQLAQAEHQRIEASWRERALNAEEELPRTQKEVFAQRQQIGELMGQIRDFDRMVPGESLQALTVENTTLKRRTQQLTQEHRKLQERLEGARTNRLKAPGRTSASRTNGSPTSKPSSSNVISLEDGPTS